MNHYELLYLISGNYSDDEVLPIKDKVKSILAKFEGQITLEDNLGKKKLAYPVKKIKHGYYLLYEFDLAPEKLKALDRELKLSAEILRHQIVVKKLQSPSLIEITEQKIKHDKETFEEGRKKTEKSDKDKIKLEDLDQKLDRILEGDIL